MDTDFATGAQPGAQSFVSLGAFLVSSWISHSSMVSMLYCGPGGTSVL